MRHPFFDRLYGLVEANEPLVAAEELREFLSGQPGARQSKKYWSEILLQISRLSRLYKERRVGSLSREAFEQGMTQISGALLELIGELKDFGGDRLPVRQSPVDIPVANPASPEAILGRTSQLKKLAWLQEALECGKAVCRVVTGDGLGTGFLSGRGILVTNNHVIRSKADVAEAAVEFNFEEDEKGRLRRVSRYALNADRFATSERLDCTMVEILQGQEEVNLTTWGSLKMESVSNVVTQDHVSIIQHPQGGVKQICLTNNEVVGTDGNKIQYTTDTMPGSSGSPVFNDSWHVVAVHHAGGNLIRGSRREYIFVNQGVLTKAILEETAFRELIFS